MTLLQQWAGVLALVAIVIATISFFGSRDSAIFGEVSGTTNYSSLRLSDDLTVDDDATVTDDLTVSGGALGLTTSNTATSSLTAGCWQLTATSTASPIKVIPVSISTTTTTFGAATVGFPLIAVFGTCP